MGVYEQGGAVTRASRGGPTYNDRSSEDRVIKMTIRTDVRATPDGDDRTRALVTTIQPRFPRVIGSSAGLPAARGIQGRMGHGVSREPGLEAAALLPADALARRGLVTRTDRSIGWLPDSNTRLWHESPIPLPLARRLGTARRIMGAHRSPCATPRRQL